MFPELDYSPKLKNVLGVTAYRLMNKNFLPEYCIRDFHRLRKFQAQCDNENDKILIEQPINALAGKIFDVVHKEALHLSRLPNSKAAEVKARRLKVLRKVLIPLPFDTPTRRDISHLVERQYAEVQQFI